MTNLDIALHQISNVLVETDAGILIQIMQIAKEPRPYAELCALVDSEIMSRRPANADIRARAAAGETWDDWTLTAASWPELPRDTVISLALAYQAVLAAREINND